MLISCMRPHCTLYPVSSSAFQSVTSLTCEFRGSAENAGVENAGADSRGGKCRSDNGWKAVRKEKYKIPTT